MTLADRLTYLLVGLALAAAGTLGGLWLVGIRAGAPARADCGCLAPSCVKPCSTCCPGATPLGCPTHLDPLPQEIRHGR